MAKKLEANSLLGPPASRLDEQAELATAKAAHSFDDGTGSLQSMQA